MDLARLCANVMTSEEHEKKNIGLHRLLCKVLVSEKAIFRQ